MWAISNEVPNRETLNDQSKDVGIQAIGIPKR